MRDGGIRKAHQNRPPILPRYVVDVKVVDVVDGTVEIDQPFEFRAHNQVKAGLIALEYFKERWNPNHYHIHCHTRHSIDKFNKW